MNASHQPLAGSKDTSIPALVAALPEIYQPIFGHPELSQRTTRACEDRLVHITQIYKALETTLGRPLRVLDLGCAQGFFSLSLAKLGAVVHGIELQACNVAMCNALAAENPGLKATFQTGLIEETIIQTAQQKQVTYDLVLGLSVLHHIVHIIGAENVEKMLAVLARITHAGIYELASAQEPTKRAESQLQNPRDLLSGYAFVHELAQIPIHLGGMSRPLYFASNRHWVFGETAGVFDTWRDYSHEMSKGSTKGTRRYFFGDGKLVKLFRLDNPELAPLNTEEHTNETAFLSSPPPGFPAPRLLAHGKNPQETWIARELLPGELLLDRICAGKSYDAASVVKDVLEQLAVMEAKDLYHNDFRVWNILIAPDERAHVIDYGAISSDKRDRGWPYDIFLSFVIVLHDIAHAKVSIPDPVRPAPFNPENFPETYRGMLWKLIDTDPLLWSFALLRDNFDKAYEPRAGVQKILSTMEDALKIQRSSAHYWRQRAPKE